MAISSTTRRGFTRGGRYRSAYRRSASATDAGSSRTTASPSTVHHRAPSTWHTATRAAPARTCRTLADVPYAITRTSPASASRVAPTGTTCGDPSARNVVSVHR
jgi:hypothetical protein